MNDKDEKKLKKFFRIFLIYIVEFLGFANIILSFPYKLKNNYIINIVYANYVNINHILLMVIGLSLVILGYGLKKRMQVSWYAIIIILPILILLSIIKVHKVFNIFAVIELLVFIALFLDKKYYSRTTNPISFKKALIIIMVSVIILIIHTAIGFYVLRNEYKGISHFYNSLVKSIELLFFMDTSAIEAKSQIARIYVDSIISLNWISIILFLILLMKPLIYKPYVSIMEIQKARKLVNKYADNPITYLALEDDKTYFFSKSADGVIAYTIASGVAVCCGDPVCDIQNIYILLSEFLYFCKENDLNICFCQASDKYMDAFIKMNFGYVKYGEEAMFKLDEYTLAGGKAAKVRYAVNHANKLGIDVVEYIPSQGREYKLENEILDVSKEWLSFKKSSELSFMLGGIGLENPMDKRYFVAYDSNNVMQGFVVFTPFSNKKGYHADVTRRRKNAPIGVMEKIIISAFEKMKNEGVEYGSLGLAPLANIINNKEHTTIIEKALDFIYENMNNLYGFKTLYHYKRNYGPTDWKVRYLIYYPKKFTPQIAYSIIKAQNPKGVKDYIFSSIKNIFSKESNSKDITN